MKNNFRKLKDIPVFPNPLHIGFSVEKALTYQPDPGDFRYRTAKVN